jgi:nucleoside 2-deoxyribosyltransferase
MEIFMNNVIAAHKSIYLCGPINGCTDEECRDWREFIKTQWPGRCIDPMVRDYRGRETEAYREIVELDKIDVADADIILVNYDKPSVGTSMEVLFAWQIGKRVIVVCRDDAVISPWLRYHAHHICHSWDDALTIAKAA